MSLRERYIGDRAFYRMVLRIAVPIMIQNGITSFVNMLDNLMVGRLGTEAMSSVSIVNQFIFVFNLLIFGAVSAAGIFTAQYHGSADAVGVRHTFRFKLLVNVAATVLGIGAFLVFGGYLVNLFLHEGGEGADLALTATLAHDYLWVMLIGLAPYAVSQVYASTMRETGQTLVPLVASSVAVVANLLLNVVFIFGIEGLIPAMGVAGAAVATVIARFLEVLVLVVWAHRHTDACPYLVGVYRSLRIPRELARRIILGGLPLIANELLWSLAITVRTQCFSTRGLDVVAAMNISTTLYNVFSVVYLAMGIAIAIIIGNLLGAGKCEEAQQTDRKLVVFSVFCSVLTALLILATSPAFPLLYETTDTVRRLATYFLMVQAVAMPFDAFANASYFTIRSGGRVLVTVLSDSGFMWAVVVPVCTLLAYATALPIAWLFPLCFACDALKALLGLLLLRHTRWARRLVADENPEN